MLPFLEQHIWSTMRESHNKRVKGKNNFLWIICGTKYRSPVSFALTEWLIWSLQLRTEQVESLCYIKYSNCQAVLKHRSLLIGENNWEKIHFLLIIRQNMCVVTNASQATYSSMTHLMGYNLQGDFFLGLLSSYLDYIWTQKVSSKMKGLKLSPLSGVPAVCSPL